MKNIPIDFMSSKDGSPSPSFIMALRMEHVIANVAKTFVVDKSAVCAVQGENLNQNKALVAAAWVAVKRLNIPTHEVASALNLTEKQVGAACRIADSELQVNVNLVFAKKVKAVKKKSRLSAKIPGALVHYSVPTKKDKPLLVASESSCTTWLRKRKVILDGCNMIFWGGEGHSVVSLELLLALCVDLKAKGVDYQVYFDASTWHHLEEKGMSGEAELYQLLLNERGDRFIEVLEGTEADVSILKEVAAAKEKGELVAVATRDHFRNYAEDFPFVTDSLCRLEGRLMKSGVMFDEIGWFVPLKGKGEMVSAG